MIEHRFTRRELRIQAWLIVALGLAGAAVVLADLIGAHALGLFRPVQAVTPDLIGLACALLVLGLGVLGLKATRATRPRPSAPAPPPARRTLP
jgi:hypothetical protein